MSRPCAVVGIAAFLLMPWGAGCDRAARYRSRLFDAAQQADSSRDDGPRADSGPMDGSPDEGRPTNNEITSFSVGSGNACAIRRGTLYCWGWNEWGNLGDGDRDNVSQPAPLAVFKPKDVVAFRSVHVAMVHICAITENSAKARTVHCWGYPGWGAVGPLHQGSSEKRPYQATEMKNKKELLSGVVELAAGHKHTCARIASASGTFNVRCWGQGPDGQLGDGKRSDKANLPSTIPRLPARCNVTRIVAGGHHTCAICAPGAVYCWGDNARGQLGANRVFSDRGDALTPVAVILDPATHTELADADGLWAGLFTTCARRRTGEVVCWGANRDGQLGGPMPLQDRKTARPVLIDAKGTTLKNVRELALGDRHSCALFNDHRVQCWGDNLAGQLGDGTTTNRIYPAAAPVLQRVLQIRSWANTTCALTARDLRCWGAGGRGQIGDGKARVASSPVAVLGLPSSSRATSISAGERHSCAVLESGDAYCWGNNRSGQLGNANAKYHQARALRVPMPNNTKLQQISAGRAHTCALAKGGAAIYCWGENGSRQLGIGTTTSSFVPVKALFTSGNIAEVRAGASFTCLRTNTGKIYCAGSNRLGQLGTGSGGTWRLISPLPSARSLAVGDASACATTTRGSLYCWGSDSGGILGLQPASPPRAVPIPRQMKQLGTSGTTSPLSNITAVALGRYHGCASREDPASGIITLCWGSNSHGRLGTSVTRPEPWLPSVAVPKLVGAQMLAAAPGIGWTGAHSCATVKGGPARCWGWNSYGQLGDGKRGAGGPAPVLVSTALKNPGQIVTGTHHSCAIDDNAEVYCWGYRGDGAVGDGLPAATQPRAVAFPP